MELITSIRKAIDYMEKHLTDNISAQDVADQVYLSPFFLQKGFSLITGYGLGEYIRNRRLHNAALDLKETEDKVTVIDPESVRDKLYEIACDMAEKYATAVSEAEPCGAFERREKNHGKQSTDGD